MTLRMVLKNHSFCLEFPKGIVDSRNNMGSYSRLKYSHSHCMSLDDFLNFVFPICENEGDLSDLLHVKSRKK
jgi:hypothetical protein